ncbi:MAG: bifunctional glutamate N-acetyltransferase/amino-acid acetyltransferase ArgJ [Methyloligellaceae bacterium]
MAVSPFAPKTLPALPPLDGARLAACEAGIRYQGRKDLLQVLLPAGTTVGGVLTRSKTASAPVEWCRARLADGGARALVVNSGNANAFTGMRGRATVEATVASAAAAAGCTAEEVFVASTGVIGEPLDPDRFKHLLEGLAADADASAWEDAARAIMTTDTYPKLATRTVDLDGVPVTINGIAKGAGMIAPDMATMLSFIFTDAPLAASVVQALCTASVASTFNAITIDGDTSTSDTVLLFATGAAAASGAPSIAEASDPRLSGFAGALEDLMRDLAHQIVKDGEGARKFVAITVTGAESDGAARRIAFSIANSPLVKTAFAGEDPNWGRIVMAVGKAGEAADRDRLAIWFGEMRVAVDGERDPDYQEADAAAYMKRSELEARVDVGVGDGEATVWTCDLTAEYISVNADYRS